MYGSARPGDVRQGIPILDLKYGEAGSGDVWHGLSWKVVVRQGIF